MGDHFGAEITVREELLDADVAGPLGFVLFCGAAAGARPRGALSLWEEKFRDEERILWETQLGADVRR